MGTKWTLALKIRKRQVKVLWHTTKKGLENLTITGYIEGK